MCRISSDEQSNHSIPYQEETIRKYCEFKGYNIVRTYLEDYSAKNFERPEWKKKDNYEPNRSDFERKRVKTELVGVSTWNDYGYDKFIRSKQETT